MATYLAPKLIKTKILLTLLVGGGVFCVWLFQTQPGDIVPILVFALLWYGSLFLAWWWSRGYVKTMEVIDHVWQVVSQGGKEVRFSMDEIGHVQVNSYFGYQEAVVRLKTGQTIRFTDHMPDFHTVLAILGVSINQPKADIVKRHVRRIYVYLGVFLAVAVLSVFMGLWQGGRVATFLYAGAGLSVLVCIIGLWIISLAKRPSSSEKFPR